MLNLLNLLSNEVPIAGLEISDLFLRLALVKKSEDGKISLDYFAEEKLNPGVISGGEIKNKDEFFKSVKNLKTQAKQKAEYLIVSLPADKIYAKVFAFPPSVEKEKINESMRLVVNFSLPKKEADIYADWENINENDETTSLLAAIPKNISDAIITALSSAGFKIIAMEFHPMSIARITETAKENPVLIAAKTGEQTTVSIIKNKLVRFCHTLAPEKSIGSEFNQEINKIISFYEFQHGKISSILPIGEIKKSDIDLPLPVNEEQPPQLIAMGAATRGLIPRSQDTIISLMNIGTEQAYMEEKALSYAKFLTNLTVALSIFIILAFSSAWVLMLAVQENFNNLVETSLQQTVPVYTNELEQKVLKFNALLAQTGAIAQEIPYWSYFLEEFSNLVKPAITISSFNISSITSPITITGIAANRSELNQFKKSLETADFISDVNVPLQNLEQKENIPFTANFRISNPKIILPQI